MILLDADELAGLQALRAWNEAAYARAAVKSPPAPVETDIEPEMERLFHVEEPA